MPGSFRHSCCFAPLDGARRLASAAVVLTALAGGAAGQEPGKPGAAESVEQTVCRIIEAASIANQLPPGYLTRLIWQESSFRPHVVSPAGAQGIAQFMPGTAGERGLADPFDPEAAIPKAADFLADLNTRFGNLGLAAAAYNAGPARVRAWRDGRGELPFETRNYVAAVTGHPAEDWTGDIDSKTADEAAKTFEMSCSETVAQIRRGQPILYARSPLAAPWGVQLSGSFSKTAALSIYARAQGRYATIIGELEPMVLGGCLRSRGSRPFYRVRAPAQTRSAASQLCDRIRAAGGACAVLKS